MIKSTKRIKDKTAEDFLADFEAVKDKILEPGETAVQMVNHHPMYFVTDKGRVISVGGRKGLTILQQVVRGGREAVNEKANKNEKACVCICIDEKKHVEYVHRLVAQYFPLKKYITEKGIPVIHHIKTYNMDNPRKSNEPENLEMIGSQSLHKTMHHLLFTTENEKDFLKNAEKLSKLTNPNYNASVIEISPDGNERSITAMSYDELLEYLKNGELIIQHVAYEPIENEKKDGDAIDV